MKKRTDIAICIIIINIVATILFMLLWFEDLAFSYGANIPTNEIMQEIISGNYKELENITLTTAWYGYVIAIIVFLFSMAVFDVVVIVFASLVHNGYGSIIAIGIISVFLIGDIVALAKYSINSNKTLPIILLSTFLILFLIALIIAIIIHVNITVESEIEDTPESSEENISYQQHNSISIESHEDSSIKKQKKFIEERESAITLLTELNDLISKNDITIIIIENWINKYGNDLMMINVTIYNQIISITNNNKITNTDISNISNNILKAIESLTIT